MANHDLTTPEGVQAFLAGTPFASDTVTALSGGFANFAYRLHLAQPYAGHATLVLKHAQPYVAAMADIPFAVTRQAFEVAALRRVSAWLPPDALVTVPTVHLYDASAHAIIMDDCGPAARTLKALLQRDAPPVPLAREIGRAIGGFLARLHVWGRGEGELVEFVAGNTQAKEITAMMTYGRLVSTVTGADNLPALADEPLNLAASDVEILDEVAKEMQAAMVGRSPDFSMGDFWPGNIVVDVRGEKLERIYVLDWEAAKDGLRGLEVGQFCAEMHLLQRFHPDTAESSKAANEAFLAAYRESCEVNEQLTRHALVHLGTHLVTWCPRIRWGSKEDTRAVVREGVDVVLKGYQPGVRSLRMSDWLDFWMGT